MLIFISTSLALNPYTLIKTKGIMDNHSFRICQETDVKICLLFFCNKKASQYDLPLFESVVIILSKDLKEGAGSKTVKRSPIEDHKQAPSKKK